MDNSTSADADDITPADIPPGDFYQKFKIPMFILFSTIAIAILGSTIWQCCLRKSKKSQKNDLEELAEAQFDHHYLPPFTGQVYGHLHGSSAARGREDDIMHLPYSYPVPYLLPFPYNQQDGSRAGTSSTSTSTRERYGDKGRHGGNRTSSGWWRHNGASPGPDNRHPLYQRRQTRRHGLGVRVPPTTGTPLDGAYSMVYMQEETSQDQSRAQDQPQHGQEGYEIEEATHKGQQARREATPPPPYKARRSTDNIHMVDRPPGCLCANV